MGNNPLGSSLPAELWLGTLSAYVIRSARAPGGPARKREGLSRASCNPGESRERSAGVGPSADSLSEHKRRPIRPLWLALRGQREPGRGDVCQPLEIAKWSRIS